MAGLTHLINFLLGATTATATNNTPYLFLDFMR